MSHLAVVSLRARRPSQPMRIKTPHCGRFSNCRVVLEIATLSGLASYIPALLLALLFLLALSAQARSEVPAGAHPHTICANCHLSEGAPEGTIGGERKIRACVDCHRKVLVPSDSSTRGAHAISGHALDISSAANTAPLGGKSFERLECLTCHLAHYQGEPKLLRLNEKGDEAIGGNRLDPTSRLCISCHPLGNEFKSAGRGGYVRHPAPSPKFKV